MSCESQTITWLRPRRKHALKRALYLCSCGCMKVYTFLLLGILLSVAVLPLSAYAGTGTMQVFVSIVPQAYFVQRIAGQHAQAHVLVGPGQSPHVFEATPRQIALLNNADLYFTIGLPFERQLTAKICTTRTRLRCVDTTRGIPLRQVEGHTHHGDGYRTTDPHIWLSPPLIKIQATTIAEALCTCDQGNAHIYRENLKRFHADLDVLDAEIREKLSPFAGRDVFVFHPAFGYFADTYGLRQVAVEIEGKEPGSRHLATLVERAKENRVRVIFAERQFSRKTAEAFARQIGADVVVLDPLAEDCFENLRSIADLFANALTKGNMQ